MTCIHDIIDEAQTLDLRVFAALAIATPKRIPNYNPTVMPLDATFGSNLATQLAGLSFLIKNKPEACRVLLGAQFACIYLLHGDLKMSEKTLLELVQAINNRWQEKTVAE